MALIASRDSSNNIPKLAPGTYQACCCAVIDLGRQYNEKWEKTQNKIMLMWDIVGESIEIDGEERPRRLSKQYTNSLSEKATLTKDINSWRGKPFSEDELKAFDLTRLINAGCLLNVIHENRNDKTYATICAIVAPPKGTKIEPISEPIIYDADNHNEAAFGQLPGWVQDMIRNSEQWKDRNKADSLEPDATDDDLPF